MNAEHDELLNITGPMCICSGPCCTWDQEFVVSTSARWIGWCVSDLFLFHNLMGFFVKNFENIRIYHEYDDEIGKSVSKIIVWHCKAYKVMTNSAP